MSRLKRWTAALLGATMIVVGGTHPALAVSSNVEYVGGAAGFVLLPDNDLWDGMKNLMPGDVVTDSIVIGNRASVACDLYLSTQPDAEGVSGPLMSQLGLRIALVTAQGTETELYNGPATGSSGNIHLGRYAAGTGATLTATLSVPATLGNEYQHLADSVVWRFAATEYRPPVDHGGGGGGGSTVVTKTPAVVKVGAAGLLPATGSQSKL